MNFGAGFAIYFIMWWLSLLMVLPFGVRTQEESGSVELGTVASAPAKPMIRRQLVATTLLAAAFFSAYYFVWINDLVILEDIPFFDPPSVLRKT